MPPRLPFDRPPYDVVAVFDPDGVEPSFAHGLERPVFRYAGTPAAPRTRRWADLLLGHAPGTVRTALAQPFGPCTAGVELLLDLLDDADEGLLLCVASLDCVSGGGTRTAFAELDALARTAGRGPWVRRAKAEVDARLTAFTLRMPVEELEELDWHVGTAFRCAVTAWVMADLIDEGA